MVVNLTNPPKQNKKIREATGGEAFRWGKSWYVRLWIKDDEITNFGDFCDEHYITDMNPPLDYNSVVAVMHLGGQSLCYVNGNIEPDEWANISASLCVK